MRLIRSFILIALFMTIAWMISCSPQSMSPNESDRLMIENDATVLNQRIAYFDDTEIPLERNLPVIESGENSPHRASLDQSSEKFKLMLRAEAPPPLVDGQVVHASHVTFDNLRAYVSYSTPHKIYRGAVEIYDIFQIRRPRLRSQALFFDTDVTIARQDEGRLFLGGATDSDNNADFESPACYEVIHLRTGHITKNTTRRDLPSFNANDIACFDQSIYLTGGTTDGYLAVFPEHTTEPSAIISIPGAKAVGRNSNYVIVLEGTGTRLHLYARHTLTPVKSLELGCENQFQGKAEIEVVGDVVYVSAGTCGLLAVDLNTEGVTTAMPAPTDGVTNGVSVSDDLVFLANGSDGMLVAQITEAGLQTLGAARFEGSTNFVAANGNVVFVANGTGGLKILEIVK